MKTISFIIIQILVTLGLNAQEVEQRDTIKGEKASYCREIVGNTLFIRNTLNKDTLVNMIFDDGTKVPYERELKGSQNFHPDEIYQVFKDAFTLEELQQLNITGGMGRFSIDVVFDKNGNVLELSFVFHKKIPILPYISADRFFELESKLKKIIKWNMKGDYYKIKNIKLIVPVYFPNLFKG